MFERKIFLTSAWQVYKLWQVKTIDIELLSRVNTSEKQIINRNPRDFLGTVVELMIFVLFCY